MHNLPYKALAISLCAATLTGCASIRSVTPPGPPAPADVFKTLSDINTAFTNATGVTPAQYVDAGYLTVDRNCKNFFVDLTNARRQFDYARSEITLGMSFTSTALALAKQSAKTLAYLAAGGAFVDATLDNTGTYVFLTQYTSQLQSIVSDQQRAYAASNPASAAGTDKIKAVDIVEGYARICTVDNLEAVISASLSNTKGVAGTAPTTTVDNSGIVTQKVAKDLGIATVSAADLQALYGLLTAKDDSTRMNATGTLQPATGKYWDANGAISTTGTQTIAIIALLAPAATIAPTPPAAVAPVAAASAPAAAASAPLAVAVTPPVAVAVAAPIPTPTPITAIPAPTPPLGQGSKTYIGVASKGLVQ